MRLKRKSDWDWCEKINETRYKIYFRTPITKKPIMVDKRTGIGKDMITGQIGSWFTFKKQEYGIDSREFSRVTVNPNQIRMFK